MPVSMPMIGKRLHSIEIADDIDEQALRNWYAGDVPELVREVMQLRQERRQALEQLHTLPIERQSDNLLDVVAQVLGVWELKLSTWQRNKLAEYKHHAENAELAQSEAEARAVDADRRTQEALHDKQSGIAQAHRDAEQRVMLANQAQQEAERQRDQARALMEWQKTLTNKVLDTLYGSLTAARKESQDARPNP